MRVHKQPSPNFAIGAALVFALLMLGAGSSNAQVASPLQPGHYAPGVINIRDLATPPPGLFVLWYNWFISSGEFIDRNGNELSSINLSEIDPDLPDIDVDLDVKGFATVPYVAWSSTFTVLGGRYIAGISPNYMVADYTVQADPGGPGLDPVGNRKIEGTVSGFSDLLVSPVGLSWAVGRFADPPASDEAALEAGLAPFRRFNLAVYYSFIAPTGRYESGADDNIGLGFWTHQFQGFGYFFPVSDQSTAIMAGLTYELNGEIKDVAVNPGNRLSLEWGVSQYLSSSFELGVQGAHNWQITDDSGADVFWDPTVHDQKSTLLFSAGFWPWAGRLNLTAKYGFDFGVRQRFKNNNFLLNVVWITNFLTGM